MAEQAPARVSHERLALPALQRALEGCAEIEVFSGQGAGNRFGPVGWELTLGQQFQFGDLRVETPTATVVVELESGGGVGNLVKYWPLLAAGELPKKLAIIHVFQIASVSDYITHRRLWEFVVERMREDLDRRGIAYATAWEAQLFTYDQGTEPLDAAAFLRSAVLAASAVEQRPEPPSGTRAASI